LKQLVKTDFKLRYQNSVLGYVWSLLKPLFLSLITYMVFVKILKVDYNVHNSGAYLLLGIVLYSFFSELTGGSVGSVVGKGDLLRKINFPRYAVVLASCLSAAINLSLNLIIVILFIIFGGLEVNLDILFAPLLIAEIFIFGTGLAFFLSAVFVKLRDIGHIWDVVLQALFYGTPILFPVAFAPLWLQKIIMLNPLAQAIQDLRYVLVSHNTVTMGNIYGSEYIRLVPILITLLIAVLGAMYFRKQSKYFAEEI
jgi:ABC-2 type transport system permease protein